MQTITPPVYPICRGMLIVSLVALGYCLASVILDMGGLIWFVLLMLVIASVRQRGRLALDAFGTARWADVHDLRLAGMVGGNRGLILGRMTDDTKPPILKAIQELFDVKVSSKTACEQFLASIRFGERLRFRSVMVRMPNAIHSMICAPTSTGKGASFVIPFLLTSSDSAVVVDFKGENFRLTAEHRRKVFGHKIVALDPFRVVTQTPDSLNPLDFIDRDSLTAIDDCRDLAEALVIRTGNEKDPHWPDSAEAWIAGLIALVVQYGEVEDRSLQTVRTLLANPEKLALAIRLMCASDKWNGMLSRMGYQLTQFKERELSSTLTTTNRFQRFLDTLAVAESTQTSSFDPDSLRGGKMTIYLVLPPAHMRAQSALLRMWIGSLLRAVVRGGLENRNPVHFVLDEAASLGHMESLDDAIDKYRAYAVRLIFFFQSLGQLKKCFPDGQDQTFLSNVSSVFFGTNDLASAEYVSNRLGEETIVIQSGGTGSSMSRQNSMKGDSSVSYSTNDSNNWSQHGRKLLKPEEVLALHERTAITFTPGVRPVCTTLVRYYEEASLLPREPSEWERVKATARVFTGSLGLMLLAGAVALLYADKRNDQYREQRIPPQYRKADESWLDETSSR